MKNSKLDLKAVTSFLSEMDLTYSVLSIPYGRHDCRVWTVQVDPQKLNFLLTCCVNRSSLNEVTFDILTNKEPIIDIHADDLFSQIQILISNLK